MKKIFLKTKKKELTQTFKKLKKFTKNRNWLKLIAPDLFKDKNKDIDLNTQLDKISGEIEEVKKLFPKFVQLPKVYLLHGHLSNKEVNELYNHPKVKAMVSMTHGEGFGRPLLEATMVGLPVIAPGWSGQLDFLDKNHSLLVGGELVDLPNSMVWEDVLIKESKWFNPSNEEMSNLLSFGFKNPYYVRENAK